MKKRYRVVKIIDAIDHIESKDNGLLLECVPRDDFRRDEAVIAILSMEEVTQRLKGLTPSIWVVNGIAFKREYRIEVDDTERRVVMCLNVTIEDLVKEKEREERVKNGV